MFFAFCLLAVSTSATHILNHILEGHTLTPKAEPYEVILILVLLRQLLMILHNKVSNGVMRSRLLARGNFDDKGEGIDVPTYHNGTVFPFDTLICTSSNYYG